MVSVYILHSMYCRRCFRQILTFLEDCQIIFIVLKQTQILLKVLKFVKKQCLTYLHNMSICTNVFLYSKKSLPEVILNWQNQPRTKYCHNDRACWFAPKLNWKQNHNNVGVSEYLTRHCWSNPGRTSGYDTATFPNNLWPRLVVKTVRPFQRLGEYH